MKKKVFSRIESDGPLRFDEFMEMCLYDPEGGFFSSGSLRPGERADFVTSPEITDTFGVLIGGWALHARPRPDSILVEVGAGSGALLAEMAPYWFDDDLPVYAVERSVMARAVISDRFPDVNVVASLTEIPASAGAVVVANELLDNLPAALARRTGEDWVEIAIGSVGGALEIVDVPAREDVIAWCDDIFPDAPYGSVVTVQFAAARWITQIIEMFDAVSVCLIDYGAKAGELIERDVTSIVRTYRRHRTDIDWLAHPGESDITVDVNIDGVVKAAADAGAVVAVSTQREMLLDQGAMELIDDAMTTERYHASRGDVMDQLIERSRRIGIEALLDPGGLGGFTVFEITKGT